MAQLFTADRFTPVDGNGHVYAGAKLYFYQTGTTTLQTVYADAGAAVALSNPVVADANGLFPAIYLSNQNAYKTVLTLSDGLTLVRTTDPISAGSGASTTFTPQGRLTLASGTPVMTANQTAATSIFYTPYNGNQIPIYDGVSAFVATTFAELTNLTTQSVTGNAGPAAVTLNSNYDLFVWNNAGVATLTRGPAWSSDTARGAGAGTTQLQAVNGVQTNAVAIVNGPAANRGTYVGSVRSDGSSQINWKAGAISAGGTAAILGVWNIYNRVPVTGLVGDNTNSWTVSGGVWRAANSSPTMRASFLQGMQEDPFEGRYFAFGNPQGVGSLYSAVGFTITAPAAAARYGVWSTSAPAGPMEGWAATTLLGFAFVQAVELNTGVVGTAYGSNAGTFQTGLSYNGKF